MVWEIGYRDVDTPPAQPEKVGEVDAPNPDAAIEGWIGEGAKSGLYGVREKGEEVWRIYRLDRLLAPPA